MDAAKHKFGTSALQAQRGRGIRVPVVDSFVLDRVYDAPHNVHQEDNQFEREG